jgi:hypothetical protein
MISIIYSLDKNTQTIITILYMFRKIQNGLNIFIRHIEGMKNSNF